MRKNKYGQPDPMDVATVCFGLAFGIMIIAGAVVVIFRMFGYGGH